jgi:anhydro-N-acetylmuramic acid kinase
MDLALKGQGAPLVPVGDNLLFSEYDACLNLGGISNISFKQQGQLLAFDISPCNIVLNRVARWLGMPYDAEGQIADSAAHDDDLLGELNDLPYYSYQGAKSLGREWINEEFWPIVKMYTDISEAEKMATLNRHIAQQIAKVVKDFGLTQILVTGGGAFNRTLLKHLGHFSGAEFVVPDPKLVNYKEALIFAFLGVLRIKNQENVYRSVTGSKSNHVAGALHGNFNSLI